MDQNPSHEVRVMSFSKETAWSKLIDQITGGNRRSHDVLQEFAGYCLMGDCRYQRFLVLHGLGAGKTSFIAAITRMVNERNVTYWDCSRNLSRLEDVAVVICDGPPAGDFPPEFKSVVGGDPLVVSDRFFVSHAKVIIDCNVIPQDLAQPCSFSRRALAVEFAIRTFDFDLAAKLLAEPWVIRRWATDGLVRLVIQGRFSDCP